MDQIRCDRWELKSTGRPIFAKVLKIAELTDELPVKFKTRLCQSHIDGNEGVGFIMRHADIGASGSEEPAADALVPAAQDLVQCLLTDFEKEIFPASNSKVGQSVSSAPTLFTRSATHMKITALIALSRQLDLPNFVKIAMGEIGRNLQVRIRLLPSPRFLTTAKTAISSLSTRRDPRAFTRRSVVRASRLSSSRTCLSATR